MIDYMKSRETVVWIALMIVTCVSWMLGANHGLPGASAGIGRAILFGLAFIKIRLVMYYFMEIRHGPRALKWSMDGWIIFSYIGLVLLTSGTT